MPLVGDVLHTDAVTRVALETHYERRVGDLDKGIAAAREKSDGFSRRRGVVVLIALPLVVLGLVRTMPTGFWAIPALLFLVFVALIVGHAKVATEVDTLEERLRIVKAGLRRARGETPEEDRRRAKLADPFGLRFSKPEHPYAGDLDLFGPHGLFPTVSRAETAVGEETLARWLLEPATVDEVRARQEAATELLEDPVLLEDLAVLARRAGSRGRTDEPLSVWGEAPAELPVGPGAPPAARSRGVLVLAARLLVPATVILFASRPWLASMHRFGSLAWLLTFVLQLGVLVSLFGAIARMVSVVSSREAPFGRFRAVFARIEGLKPRSTILAKHVAALRGDGAPASVEIARLERVVGFADLRHNTLVHLVVNLSTLYDVWVALALEKWRARSGRRARGWITALGELEALASLATYAGEHPDFAWPEVDDGPARLEAEGLGHPLIDAKKRVVNDTSLPAPGRAYLVTGSNMSGKSTFLRSLGLGTVMAFAGLPVCAKRASFARMETWTSMRVGDALDQGMSHFMAELMRLRSVVAAAQKGHKVLFLLDEILHGTNSRERTIGARGVVMDLVEHGAIGGVSTHDFALISIAEESDGRVETVHFSDRIEDGQMLFDFALKRGVVQSTNAIRLMKAVGIDVAYESESKREGAG